MTGFENKIENISYVKNQTKKEKTLEVLSEKKKKYLLLPGGDLDDLIFSGEEIKYFSLK
jgi:hypothetical protein